MSNTGVPTPACTISTNKRKHQAGTCDWIPALGAVEPIWKCELSTADGVVALDNIGKCGGVLVNERLPHPPQP